MFKVFNWKGMGWVLSAVDVGWVERPGFQLIDWGLMEWVLSVRRCDGWKALVLKVFGWTWVDCVCSVGGVGVVCLLLGLVDNLAFQVLRWGWVGGVAWVGWTAVNSKRPQSGLHGMCGVCLCVGRMGF